MFKCKFCQIDGHDCRKKKAETKDKSSDNERTSKDKDTKASNSEDKSYEPRAYAVAMSQPDLPLSGGGLRAMPEINDDNDSLPGLMMTQTMKST